VSSFTPPYPASLITEKALPDRAVNSRLDRVPNRVSDADEAQVAGQGVDDVFTFVDRPLSHDRARDRRLR
jgi:hypothetical protein